jgi:rubrerythrin
MDNATLTASAIMSFSENLENQSAVFYEKLAYKFDEHRDAFLRFSKESKKSKTHLVRTYQETISDALEATFSFEAIELPGIDFDSLLSGETSFNGVIEGAVEIERRASDFYTLVAEESQSLLATIPRAFRRVAQTRNSRRETLQSFLG